MVWIVLTVVLVLLFLVVPLLAGRWIEYIGGRYYGDYSDREER